MRSVLLLALLIAAQAEGAVRVLVLTGRNNHDWRTTAPYLAKILGAVPGRFDVRLDEEPTGLNSAALANYDVLVVDYQGGRWGGVTEQAIESFVQKGGGMAVIHTASYSFCGNEILGDGHVPTGKREPPWPAWKKMEGACWVSSGEAKSGHGKRHLYEVKTVDPAHPILAGMPPSFTVSDELYHRLDLDRSAHVIATALSSKESGGTGRDEPVLWTVGYGKGRVFHTVLGHDTTAMDSAGFATTFARGVEWAATGEVTLPARILPDQYTAKAVKTYVVTGGHEHQPAFYSLFEGDRDIDASTDSHPAALHRDLGQYEVLVLHDLYPDLDEQGKATVRKWVESGKGVVVLHHALATFNNWEWWWKDVVGGRYLMKPDGGMPASTYNHDQIINVYPQGSHPVLKNVPEMQLMDETYKGQWFAPGINVLLKTDHPKSDPVLAWISSYKGARVVVIQLGHDRWSHLNPGYRQLVRNAVMWAAGRDF